MSFVVDITRTAAGQLIADVDALYGYPRYSTTPAGVEVILMTTHAGWYRSSVDGTKYSVTLRSVRRQALARAIDAGLIDIPTATRLNDAFQAAVEELPAEYLPPEPPP